MTMGALVPAGSPEPVPGSRKPCVCWRPAAQWHSVRRQDSVPGPGGLNVLRRETGKLSALLWSGARKAK